MIWALHGMVGDPADWDFLKPELPVVARQLWAEVDRYESWARKFCREVQQKDPAPILLGYSMGGRLALHALLSAPHLWRAAILVSAHTGLPDRESRAIRWRQDDEWSRKLRSIPWEVFLKIWNEQSIFAGSPPPGERLSTFRWRQSIIRSFDCWSLSRQENLLPRLSSLTMPVLWLSGEMDPRYGEMGRAATAMLPQGRFQEVPACGHRVPWEAPELFTAAVREFLQEHQLLERPEP